MITDPLLKNLLGFVHFAVRDQRRCIVSFRLAGGGLLVVRRNGLQAPDWKPTVQSTTVPGFRRRHALPDGFGLQQIRCAAMKLTPRSMFLYSVQILP